MEGNKVTRMSKWGPYSIFHRFMKLVNIQGMTVGNRLVSLLQLYCDFFCILLTQDRMLVCN